MKEILSLKLLFTFLFAAFAGIAGLGDPPPIPVVDPIRNEGGGGDDPIYYPDSKNCSAAPITLGVVLANLSPFGFNGESGESDEPNGSLIYGLPEGYPDMYLEYSIDNGPIDRVPLGDAHFLRVQNNIPLYRFLVTSYPVDFTNLCQEKPLEDNTFELSYTLKIVKLVDNSSSEFEDYDACNYTSECDIFSCLVFEAAGLCSTSDDPAPQCLVDPTAPYNPTGNGWDYACDPSQIISNSGKLVVSCNTCRDDVPSGPDPGGEKGDISSHTNEDELKVSIQPNPFNNEITINWSEGANIEQMSLYDMTGKIIKRWAKPDNQSFLRVNTNNLAKGLYFLKVNTTTSSKVIKLVKQ